VIDVCQVSAHNKGEYLVVIINFEIVSFTVGLDMIGSWKIAYLELYVQSQKFRFFPCRVRTYSISTATGLIPNQKGTRLREVISKK
jgi:hypothetical protein